LVDVMMRSKGCDVPRSHELTQNRRGKEGKVKNKMNTKNNTRTQPDIIEFHSRGSMNHADRITWGETSR
jgi:hypothetical protein